MELTRDGSFRGYYNGKRVLLTGHTGFKGGWLSIWLRELGADVAGYALDPPSEPNLFECAKLHEKLHHHRSDILEYDSLKKTMDDFEPEIVFHLAAQALVRRSYDEPKLTFDTNVTGTVNVLEAVRATACVKSLIVVTSDKCYENREQVWGYKEDDPMGGSDPYSASKGAAELVFRGYHRSYFRHVGGFGAASVRAGNVIGGGDWGRDRIVPDCVQALSGGRPIEIRNPMAIRPWQFVLEPLSGYLWLGARLRDDPEHLSGGWNFGPTDAATRCVRDLASAIVAAWGSGEWADGSDRDAHRLHEAFWLRLSCDKARALLPWSAVLPFEENVRMTVAWYKYHVDHPATNMYQFCAHQIREYTEIAQRQGQLWAR
jgi:CDP-glucose 4,6-dehydratase